jgi:hypothetical protein
MSSVYGLSTQKVSGSFRLAVENKPQDPPFEYIVVGDMSNDRVGSIKYDDFLEEYYLSIDDEIAHLSHRDLEDLSGFIDYATIEYEKYK